MEKYSINIGADFSPLLGGRYKSLGNGSGEAFYNEHLLPKFEQALADSEKLHIHMDSATGYGSSFLDESFGKLKREFNLVDVKETLEFHTEKFSANLDYLYSEIWEEE